jgi:hypothetical protein
LGKATEIGSVKVRWPSGKLQEFKNIRADVHYVIDEDKGIRKEVLSMVAPG